MHAPLLAPESPIEQDLLFNEGIPDTPAAWYALRRTLPAWRFDELLDEMVKVLPAQGVDEVILITDTEEFSHGMPSLEWVRSYQPLLERARTALNGAGIVYSLNPWITLGHVSRGRQFPIVEPPIGPAINADGTIQTCIACPLSAGWRTYQAEVWQLFAETRPAVIWIEDDIRSFGEHFCLCPLHLSRFGKRVGKRVSRKQLHGALVQPGTPHPWRAEFLHMQDEIMRDAMSHLAAAVHSASPATRIGLMSSGPRSHVMEGRDWKRLGAALQTEGMPVLSRPALGNYWEWDLRGMYFAQDAIKITRHALPPSAPDMTEIEAIPFSRTANSIAFLVAKLAISFAYGARGATINIFDHLGSPMRDVPQYGRLIAAMKPALNSLASETQRPGIYRGIRLFHFDASADTVHLEGGAEMAALRGEGEGAMHAFEAAGLPTTYEESDVAAVIGQQARIITDKELQSLLKHGLFLDGPAARILCERGFGSKIGLDTADAPQPLDKHGAVSAEEYLHPDFDGYPRCYISALLPNANYAARLCRLHPLSGASAISRMVNPDTEPLWAAMTAFENREGGRVIVHGWDCGTCIGAAYYGIHRSRQMQAITRWLFRERAPLIATGDGVWPLAFRKDCGDRTIVGMLPLSLDSWSEAVLTLGDERNPISVERLDSLGRWSEKGITTQRQGRILMIRSQEPLSYGRLSVARIVWAAGGGN